MLRKRLLSLVLALVMALSMVPAAFAAESEEAYEQAEPASAEQDAALQAYLDALEPLTITPVDIGGPAEEEPSEIAMLSAAEPAAEHTPGVVLFSVRAGVSVEQLGLAGLGLTAVEPVFASGSAVDTDEGSAVWYSASCSRNETSVVAALKALPGVVDAELDYVYYSDSFGEPKEVEVKTNWLIGDLLKTANQYWWSTELSKQINPGDGTIVAVIDTGVDYTHEDLAANMWVNTAELNGQSGVDDDGDGYIDDIYGVNVLASGAQAGDPMDDNGHGTHVAGIIAMSSNGQGGVGLAWGSKIMAIKAGQSTGTFTSSDIAKAIDYACMKGADVINMSFGGTEKSYLVEQALAKAFSSCVLVASAGNDALPTTDAPAEFLRKEDIYPAGYSYVLGVMATGKDGKLASFSNWDYKSNANCEYELTAPGVDIFSTLPGNRYATWSGTSMAAPCVSAAAAIVRSCYPDKNTYSARFIMGQLASATDRTTAYTDAIGGAHTYAALSILQSCQKKPEPNISLQNVFALDNAREDNAVNDADRIIDAGETIDLGFTVRNQWGQTGDITVTADAESVGGVASKWIEFTKDTVTLDSAGTFGESDNGYVWNDSYLTDVLKPITFKVSADTPNDTQICINLTATTTNDFDPKDTAVYKSEYKYTFTVQKGRAIRGELEQDMTLTSDYYWIIDNALFIPEGKTLTVKPGTQIQFWSSDYEGAYGGKTMAGIINYGTLNMIGTEEQPISCFPGKGFSNYVVEIGGSGVETLKYCEIINPRLGYTGQYTEGPVDVVDHCRLTQNQQNTYSRFVNGSSVTESGFETNCYYAFSVKQLSNSATSGLRGSYVKRLRILNNISNCFNDCSIKFEDYTPVSTETVFLRGNGGEEASRMGIPLTGTAAVPKYDGTSAIDSVDIYTYDGTGHQYVFLPMENMDQSALVAQYDLIKAMAESMGGTLLCLDDGQEENFIAEKLHVIAERTRQENMTEAIFCLTYLGYRWQAEAGTYVWDDGGDYVPPIAGNYGDNYVYLTIASYKDNCGRYFFGRSKPLVGDLSYMVLELPTVTADGEALTEEAVRKQLKSFDTDAWLFNYCAPQMTNCAILNPVLNTTPESWARITAGSYNKYIRCYNFSGNYWGTENTNLINQMIVDADDFAGTLGNIVEAPILTKDSDLSSIYPFVLSLTVSDKGGNVVSTVSPGAEYTVRVTFNRDMDPAVQPAVTYGPAAPYTDFTVRGDWKSAREWVGTTIVSPVMTSGTQYFKTTGGRAANDHWLVCGNDILRYAMTVSTTGVQAMLLQATGGANCVQLSWVQNDYATLAGYNLYRSATGKTGSFQKLNSAVLTGISYTDTDVEPGKTYYYYFTVVNTEGKEESAASNTASAAPVDDIMPSLRHTPVTSARAGKQIAISATATDNIAVTSVTLHYRKTGETTYRATDMVATNVNNGYSAVIPADCVTAAGVEYYLTAKDDDGNTAYSGTAQQPNHVAVDGSVFISGLTPNTVSIAGGKTVTLLGGSFTEDMQLRVGECEVSTYTLVDEGRLQFTAPAMPIGVYAVTLTKNGVQTASPVGLSYTDADALAQISTTMLMTSGEPYRIPFYLTSKGDMTSFHVELQLGGMGVSALTVEKGDSNAAYNLEYHQNGDTVLISGTSGRPITTAADKPLVYINVTPSAVTSDQPYELTLHEVRCNGAPVNQVIGGTATVRPNFTLNVSVAYYTDAKKPVSGVTIQADEKSGQTDTLGQLVLAGIPTNSVTVRALLGLGTLELPEYVNANDAALVLKHSVGTQVLSERQKLAADVNGDGAVNEADASLILQIAVEKFTKFQLVPVWRFVPETKTMTLDSGSNQAQFIAILMGDVDGSWGGGTQ